MMSDTSASQIDDLVIATPRKEIVFIEDNVPDLGTLIEGIGAGKEVVILDSREDGLRQIADTLAGRSGIDALHIVSHGVAGSVNLGALLLDANNLGAHGAELQAIRQGMAAGGDILLYGCDIGAGSAGQSFVDQLAIATGADVAASSNLTGSAALGGDWDLEISSGQIETQAVVDTSLAALYQKTLNITTVNVDFETYSQIANPGGRNGAQDDVMIRVNGDASYLLKIDGATQNVATYGNGYVVSDSRAGLGETLLTFNFVNGQVFSPTSIDVANFQDSTPQHLVFKAYDAANHLLGTRIGDTGNVAEYTTVLLTGLTNVAKLTLNGDPAANGGKLINLVFDNFKLTNIQPAAPVPVAPAVTSVSSSTTNGFYKAGATITLTVTFDRAVDVDTTGGTPTLQLETGSTDQKAFYSGGSGTTTLNFVYTVQAGDTSADLDYLSTAALATNGATIKAHDDATGAALTLPAPGGANSLGANKSIVIDTTAPAAPGRPVLATGSDSGTLGDGITNKPQPTITGSGAEAGATIKLYDSNGVTELGSTVAGGGGTWSIVPTAALASDAHSLTVKAIDAAGNVSAVSLPLNLTIDTTPPTLSIGSDASTLKSGETTKITFTFSDDPGAGFTSSNVTVSGGVLGAFNESSGNTRTATFTPTPNVEGTASITVAAGAYRDAADNNGAASSAPSITIDTRAPAAPAVPDLAAASDSGNPAAANWNTDNVTNVNQPTFGGAAGSAEAGATVRVYDGATLIATTTANANGSWSVASNVALAEGAHAITATATDAAGNTGAASGALTVTIDRTPPAAPGAPDLAAANDSGDSSTDNITKAAATVFSGGAAEAGAIITLYDTNGSVITTATADGSGNWSKSVALSEGAHNVTVTATDSAGNESAPSPGLAVVVDRTAPVTMAASAVFSNDTGASSTDMVTSAANGQTVSGLLNANLAAGEHVEVSLDNGANWTTATAGVGSNAWSVPATLAASNTLQVRVVDAAGNAGTAYTRAYVLDTSAPAAPSTPDLDMASDSGTSHTDDVTGNKTPSFSGTAEAGATVTLYDGATAIGSVTAAGDGKWQITSNIELGQGSHSITATAMDLAGNTGAASAALSVFIETRTPSTGIASLAFSADTGSSVSDLVTKTAAQTISGTLDANLAFGERVEVSFDNGASWTGATAAVGGNAWSLPATLAAGTHTLQVRVANSVDNSGPVFSQSYTLDQAAPSVTISSDAAYLKAGDTATVTFTFSEDPGNTFTWNGSVGDVVVSGGTLSAISGTGLVRTAVFTPAAGVNGGTGSIAVAGGSYADLAGNSGTAGAAPSLSFDTLAPGAPSAPVLDAGSDTGVSSADLLTANTRPGFTGTAESGATVTLYDTNGSEIGHDTAVNGAWSIVPAAPLAEGMHTLTARAVDAAGNVGAVSGATVVTIDTTRPTLAIGSDVSQLKAGGTATITFTFSEDPGASFTHADIAVSGGALSALSGTGTVRTAVFTPAANTDAGTAVISVAAGAYQDAAGNGGTAGTMPALHFDTLAPAAPSAPAFVDNGISNSDNIVTDARPLFKGTAENGAVIKLYDADTGVLLQSSVPALGGLWFLPTLTPMSEGTHRVYATATDAAGNVSAPSATTTITIDTVAPPEVTISSDVSKVKAGETATITFTFAADPGAEFSLANVAPTSAGSFGPLSGSGLTRTAVFTPYPNHDLESAYIHIVDYHDAAGNFTYDATGLTLLVDTKAPAAPSAPVLTAASDTGSSSSDRITSDTTPIFSGTKDAGTTVTLYDSDGSVLGSVYELIDAWGIESAALSEGTHTITAKQTDSLGNVSVLSGPVTIVVDTHADALAAPVLDPASDSAAKGDGITNATTPTLTGSAEAYATVTLYDSDGSTVLGTATADAGGAWSITSSVLATGAHDLSVRQVDLAGNASTASPVLRLNIDDAVLALDAPKLAAASDSGAQGDGITKNAAPVFSGKAEALAQVTLYDGATAIGSVQADADGAWQITAATLADGVHAIAARQVDLAGNASAAGTSFSLTVDTAAPAAPAAPALKPASDTGNIGDGLTENTNPVIEGTALANTLVTLYDTVGKNTVKLGSVLADAGGKWSIAATGLSLGVHTLSATLSDAAGNESAAGGAFTLRIMAPPEPVSLIDGMPVKIQPISLPGNVQGSAVSIPVVDAGRTETTGQAGVADIPLASSNGGSALLLAQLAPGYGLSASGASVPAASAAELLIASIKAATPNHAPADQGHLTGNGQSFLAGLASSGSLLVETVKPVSSAAPAGVLTLSGPAAGAGQSTALVIDAGGLAAGATIALQQVNFAAVIGAANVTAGSSMVLSGDGASQHFTVATGGAGSVFAGGGSDVLSVAATPAAGPAPAAGTTLLHGGQASDAAAFSGARADYNVEFHNGYVMVSAKAAPDVKAMVVNVEQLQFSDASIAVQNAADMDTMAGIYQTVLGRQADVMGIEYWANVHQAGASWGAIALSMISSNEHAASHTGFNGVAAHDIALLYTAIFNREADAGGMNFWIDAMGRGMTLEQVASSFVQSVEMVGHQRAATDWDFSVG